MRVGEEILWSGWVASRLELLSGVAAQVQRGDMESRGVGGGG